MALIEVRDLYKVFGNNPKKAIPLIKQGMNKADILKKTGCTIAINGASFSIERGETFVVMGLSGSGKSTFIRCLNRLIEPTAGEIFIDGSDIMKMDKETLRDVRRYKMSMVFQHFGLLPHRNVLSNVEFGLEVGGTPKEERHQKAMNAIKLVGLEGFELSMTNELSGGMQQRVGLARALANNPEILLMDEAFSALDPLIRTQMQDELLELQARMHKTIIFITHDLDEALKLGDRIVILGPEGNIRQIGTPEEILAEPADDYVSKFVQNVDRTRIITASLIKHNCPTINVSKDGPEAAMRIMEKYGTSHLFVVNHDRVLQGIISIDDVIKLKKEKSKDLAKIIITDSIYTTFGDTPISDLLGTALETKYPIAVIDENGVFHGVVNRSAVIREVNIGIEEEAAPVSLNDVIDQGNTREEV